MVGRAPTAGDAMEPVLVRARLTDALAPSRCLVRWQRRILQRGLATARGPAACRPLAAPGLDPNSHATRSPQGPPCFNPNLTNSSFIGR